MDFLSPLSLDRFLGLRVNVELLTLMQSLYGYEPNH